MTEVNVFDDIGAGKATAAAIKATLDTNTGPILLRINSPGGDAFEGIACYNLLRGSKRKVSTVIEGLAASAASIIAMSGSHIEMGVGAQMMIHCAACMSFGDAEEFTKLAETLRQVDKSIASIYANSRGLKAGDCLALMSKETWMSGDEAVKMGFADKATAAEKAA